VFRRTINGIALRFHLAGINNQNFLMRDEQTGTYWQQISGLAVAGPLAGQKLTLVAADELSFQLWKSEEPNGTVLQDAPKHDRDYAPRDWDVRMARAPVVISYAQAGLKPRDLMLGIRASGGSRAFPYSAVLKERLLEDRVGSEPILLVVGTDDRSVRAFRPRIPGGSSSTQFYRMVENPSDTRRNSPSLESVVLMDAESGSEWNFQGCAVAGRRKGVCLDRVDVIKDYWFDWRHYHPDTTVYGVQQRIR
jgi:Protein of unknown function (DUF3179)